MGLFFLLAILFIAFWGVGLAIKLTAWIVWAALVVGAVFFIIGLINGSARRTTVP